MNGIFTGLILILLGAIGFIPFFLRTQRTGAPFVDREHFGGYTGAMGLGIMGVGALILLVSLCVLVLG